MIFPFKEDVLKEIVRKTGEKLSINANADFPLAFFAGKKDAAGKYIYLKKLKEVNNVFPCILLTYEEQNVKPDYIKGYTDFTFNCLIATEGKELNSFEERNELNFKLLTNIMEEFIRQILCSPLLWLNVYKLDCTTTELPMFTGFPGANIVDAIYLQNINIKILKNK